MFTGWINRRNVGQARNRPRWLSCCSPENRRKWNCWRKKNSGEWSAGERIWVLSTWRPTNTKGKAMKGLVSRVTRNTGQVISLYCNLGICLGKTCSKKQTSKSSEKSLTRKETPGREQGWFQEQTSCLIITVNANLYWEEEKKKRKKIEKRTEKAADLLNSANWTSTSYSAGVESHDA